MDVRHLISFRTIVEKGNFQDAANELNYSLSAISYQIQQLENELKFPLFEKRGRRMHPTEQSLKLIPLIKNIEEEIRKIKLINSSSEKVDGNLNIAISDSLLTYIFQPVLKEFLEQAPEVKLKLKVKSCYEIQKDIIKNDIDLGIHYDLKGYDPQVNVISLAEYKVGIMASPGFPLSERDFDRKNQVKSCYIVNNDSDSVYQGYFEEYLKSKNIKIEQRIELWSLEAIKKSVVNNLGIACLPNFVVQEELENKQVIEIPIKGFKPHIKAIAAYHSNKWISPAMGLFLTILDKYMSANR